MRYDTDACYYNPISKSKAENNGNVAVRNSKQSKEKRTRPNPLIIVQKTVLETAKYERLNRHQLARRLSISVKELSLVQKANFETNTEKIYKIAKAISKEVEIQIE